MRRSISSGGRRGQIQIGETVVVLMFFFIILGFGAAFFMNYAKDKAQQFGREIDRADLAENTKILSSLPEIHCSLAGDEDLSCIDWMKAQSFATLLNGPYRLQYAALFQNTVVQLKCIYPACAVDDIELLNYGGEFKNSEKFLVPVVIYDPINDRRSFGTMEVTYYS